MTDTLQWQKPGETLEDGSLFAHWIKIEESGVWHWQYDTHEMTFDIYEHDGQYWKFYRIRYADDNGEYQYHFGGQACRMALVAYSTKTRSPHSNRAMSPGDLEWVRTYEVDEAIHRVIKAGRDDAKYGAPFDSKHAA